MSRYPYAGNRHFNIKPPRYGSDELSPDCRHDDLTELFFAPDFETTTRRRHREQKARQICSACPFKIDCALHGLEHEDFGIWGALCEADRHLLGGRGQLAGGGRRSLKILLKRLASAGFGLREIEELLARWSARRQEIEPEEEVA